MIVRNEARCLARCLTSVKGFVDEIVIVDTGSDDTTREIAREFTSHLYDFQWTDSFAEARNYSLSKATGDWILVLDADEVVSSQDLVKLRELLEHTDKDAFFLIQRNYTNDHTRPGWTPVKRAEPECRTYTGYLRNPIIRLFRNGCGIHFTGVVHEVVDLSVREGGTQLIEIPIHHYYEEKDLDTRQLRYLELCEKALRQKPDGRLYASAGAVHLNVRKDARVALGYFQKAVEYGYQTNLCRENVAECRLRLGEYEAALDLYRQLANEGCSSVPLFSNLAFLLVCNREFASALEYLRRAVTMAGDPHTLATLQQNIGHTEKLMRVDR